MVNRVHDNVYAAMIAEWGLAPLLLFAEQLVVLIPACFCQILLCNIARMIFVENRQGNISLIKGYACLCGSKNTRLVWSGQLL